ncbi:hypothetical protein CPB97_007798 [Podila verticillata]|nr:hypothetical protein CPB97_007798 [Podila verticillata]
MNYLITATTKSQEAFEHARDFGHKASEQLSYAAAQGPGYEHGTASRQTKHGNLSGSRSFSGLPQYCSPVKPNSSQAYLGSNNYNNGGNYSASGQTSHQSQEIGSGDPSEKQRWSRGNSISYSSHHYAAAHPSFKSSQGGL